MPPWNEAARTRRCPALIETTRRISSKELDRLANRWATVYLGVGVAFSSA